MHVVADTTLLTRSEWLLERRRGIGGSEAAAIMGYDPYKSPFSVWVEKTSTEPPTEEELGEEVYWGTQLEEVVAREFEKRSGLVVTSRPTIFQHERYGFMLANVDRFVADPANPDVPIGILEIKTTSARRAHLWAVEAPMTAYTQVQHYLAVLGLDKAWVACLIGGQQYIQYEVTRDDEFITRMILAEQAFWDLVERGVPPPTDGHPATTNAVNSYYGESDGGLIVSLPPEAEGLIEELERAKEATEFALQRKSAAENALKSMLGDAEYGTLDGETVATWKTQTRSGVDMNRLKSEYPEIAAHLKRETSFRVLRIRG